MITPMCMNTPVRNVYPYDTFLNEKMHGTETKSFKSIIEAEHAEKNNSL